MYGSTRASGWDSPGLLTHPVSNLNSLQDAERSHNRPIRRIQFRLAFVAQRQYIRLIQQRERIALLPKVVGIFHENCRLSSNRNIPARLRMGVAIGSASLTTYCRARSAPAPRAASECGARYPGGLPRRAQEPPWFAQLAFRGESSSQRPEALPSSCLNL
jgi:hypothetical protein